MSNILRAIINIAENPIVELKAQYTGRNTINNIGEALEAYIQDAFAGTITEENTKIRDEKITNTFSYLGNQNNPPDIILKNSDAIEVKKIQSRGSAIALNSSYPKNKLFSNDSKITDACRECEVWDIKDIIYAVGVTDDKYLKHLWLVYGDCYAASREVYSRIGKTIKEGVKEIPDIEFSETKELGRVNRVDPLVLQQHCIDGYRAIQSVQDKAWVAGNGYSLGKTHNAVLDALGYSLRASQKAVIHVVALFVKGGDHSLQSAPSG